MIIILFLGNSNLVSDAILIILSNYMFGDFLELTFIPNAHCGLCCGNIFPPTVPDLLGLGNCIAGAFRFTPSLEVF